MQNTSMQSDVAKGRIAASQCRPVTAGAGECNALIWSHITTVLHMSIPESVPSLVGSGPPSDIRGFLDLHEPASKRQLDRFIRFRSADGRNQHTDRHADHGTRDMSASILRVTVK